MRDYVSEYFTSHKIWSRFLVSASFPVDLEASENSPRFGLHQENNLNSTCGAGENERVR